MYYTYMLRCEDNSIYTGITDNLARRMTDHFGQGCRCAKYTKGRRAVRLEAAWKSADRSLASKFEYRIKRLSKAQKEYIIKTPDSLAEMFSGELDIFCYEPVNPAELREAQDCEAGGKR